ncbi:sodium:solute symporter [Halobacillus halophilus]|uniref:Sodium/panthothenate symporter n=1 Tax=Halobacillus halophilus (strain ATCC 35676 / DSM 2266 / JCM 20832 / KCTC 3685 / LMG 17431 / NBRC 102448 / NCIMB 2269) TaxID=866895 RepID=I0JKS1_HALH3|nr:sodium:solute symporter family protein [Halobacillus halophilus]ASF38872.1 sodium:solute symporter [Halobacillus halophilus]CCG44741.1 sodium/panthothenate symporter [Halobacillus halophilus DSM 2266]
MAITIFALVLLLYVVVGAFISRYVKNSDDFYTMGGRGSTILIVGTLAATYLSAATLLGIAGQSYKEGPLVIATLGSFGAWLGTLIAVVYMGRKMKALGCKTMPDFFDKRFNSKWVSIIAIIIMIVGLVGYGVIQFIGAGLVLSEITGINFQLLIVLFTIALIAFTAFGGMYGVVVTDTIMFFTMLAISIVIAPMIIGQAGFEQMKGLSETMPNYWTIGGTENRSIGWSISQFLVWIMFFACMPALVSRVFPAKNDFVILKTAIIGVFFAPFMQLTVFIAAGGMQVLQPGITPTDNAMIVGFMEFTPPAVAGVGLAALMASIMSTASTLFVLVGFALSRDLYERLFEKELNEKQSLTAARFGQIIVAVVICAIALARPSAIYWISIYAGSIFAVGWLPTIVASFEWKKMNSKAAMISMISGVASFLLFGELIRAGIMTLPTGVDELMLALLVSVLSLLGAGLVTKPNAHELNYYAEMKRSGMASITIKEFLKQPDGLQKIKKQYKQLVTVSVLFTFISVVVWGYFFIKLGL